MLEGFDTGYEGKFDFPVRRQPPRLVYMLATIPRSGSTFLSHLLWQSGCLGAPLEYLNFEKLGPYGFANASPSLQQDLWQSTLRRRTSPNGVFGFKCFIMQLQALAQNNPALLGALRPSRIIYLERRDRIAHAVSYARATITGIWNENQESSGVGEVKYSRQAITTAEEWIAVQAAEWEGRFRALRTEPLRLWYEDVLADPAKAVSQVGSYLGVAITPAADVSIPAVRKQSAAEGKTWASRYRGEREAQKSASGL